jgi:hypothetical protein
MKQPHIIIYILLYFSTTLSAQNLIAVEHGSSTSFFTRLDSAIAGASNGDKIYLPSGTFDATGLIIDKSINIIGVGYNVDSTAALGPTVLAGSTNIIIIKTAEGGSLSGCYIMNNIRIKFGSNSSNANIDGYSLLRNYIPGGIHFDYQTASIHSKNIKIIENIIGSYDSDKALQCNYAEIFLSNNIVNYVTNAGVYSQIKNNVFLSATNSFSLPSTLSGNSLVIENNVFMDGGCSFSNSQCRNNINILGGSSTFSGIDGSGNYFQNNFIVNCDSIFINGISRNWSITCYRIFSINDNSINFNLTNNSVAKRAGTDGLDIGLYGGLFPWKNGGIPSNPHLQFKTIKGTTESDGKLKVNIKVKAQDN